MTFCSFFVIFRYHNSYLINYEKYHLGLTYIESHPLIIKFHFIIFGNDTYLLNHKNKNVNYSFYLNYICNDFESYLHYIQNEAISISFILFFSNLIVILHYC